MKKKYIIKLLYPFRIVKISIIFVHEILQIFLESYPFIKPLVFKFMLSALTIIINTYIFKSLLDLNNNLQFFVMIVGSRLIHFIVIFLYDEKRLLKFAFSNKKVHLVVEKLKRKVKKNISLEKILTNFLVSISCLILKQFILGLNILDINKPFNLCVFFLMLMIFSIISKHLIFKLIKWIKRQTKY